MSTLGWTMSGVASMMAICVAVACVGDDPPSSSSGGVDPNAKVGELGGRCNAGQCFGELICDPAINVCTTRDGGGASSSGGSSGTGSSGGSSGGSSSSGNVSCPFNMGPYNGPACPDEGTTCDVDAGAKCCLGPGPATCTTSCSDGKPVACTTKSTCLPERCCLAVIGISLPQQTICPRKVEKAEVNNTRCSPDCPAGEYRVCRNDIECDGGQKCNAVVIVTDTGTIKMGVCL